jgi:hypothetical protein
MQTFLIVILLFGITSAQAQYTWMSKDVGAAWSQGYKGSNTNIIVHDTFNSTYIKAKVNTLSKTWTTHAHGEWVANIAQAIAPESSIQSIAWNAIPVLTPNRFNILNMSYAIPGTKGSGFQHFSVDMAHKGSAVVIKAAGNYNTDMSISDQNGGKNYDVLNVALKGLPGVIFAGALARHGESTPNKTTIRAGYSNYPGISTAYQNRFLMVGVPTSMTLSGTSFAAPQLSAYAAIISSKFTQATPIQVANQMLNTARTDTIRNYNPALFGRGEASLSRALSPVSLK